LSGEKTQYTKSFLHIAQCFKSDYHLKDLMKIIEGYIAPNGQPYLFDEVVTNLTREQYQNFKAFNNKDTVYFSRDAIMYFLDDETEKFEKLVEKRLLRGRSMLAANLLKYKQNLINDAERVTKMLWGVNNKQNELRRITATPEMRKEYKIMLEKATTDKNEWWKMFKNRLKAVMIGYFRFVVFREILMSYTNIPAGTIVVKLDDYTMRNIVDNYEIESLIDISKNKNDGSSKSFENDILTNIFLLTFWYYNYVIADETIREKIKKIWNTDYTDLLGETEEDKLLKEWLKENKKKGE
jgi:hypothetical protein